jgi:hypothetical protein
MSHSRSPSTTGHFTVGTACQSSKARQRLDLRRRRRFRLARSGKIEDLPVVPHPLVIVPPSPRHAGSSSSTVPLGIHFQVRQRLEVLLVEGFPAFFVRAASRLEMVDEVDEFPPEQPSIQIGMGGPEQAGRQCNRPALWIDADHVLM